MLFRSYKPSPPLSDFIENFWMYNGYHSPHLKERILPSGTFEMVFNLRDDELRIYKVAQPDRCARFSGAIVSGPYHGFFVTDAAEEASVMGFTSSREVHFHFSVFRLMNSDFQVNDKSGEAKFVASRVI